MDWVAQAIGVFYAASGILLVRAMGIDAAAVRMQAAIDGKFGLNDRVRHVLLRVGAALTIGSGLALVLLSHWSPAIMLANCVVQGAWLMFARSFFPPEDEVERAGRRQTINAFLVYAGATALVCGLVYAGQITLLHGQVADWLPFAGMVALLGWMLLS